jgi:hypothetical protein
MVLLSCMLSSFIFILAANYFLNPFRSPFPLYIDDEEFTIIIDTLMCLLVTILIIIER